eukprot:scaffold90288_cov15-Tisochrysis_lutea.AAC.2
MNSLSEPWPMYYTQDWGRKDFEDYALEEKQDDIRPLLAFIAMGIISLVIFLVWGLTSVNRGFGDDAFAAIDAPFDYVDEVKAEVDAAGKPLQTIVQEKVPEAQQFVRVNMNGNSERSSIAFRDSLEVRDTARTTEANSETKPL